MNAEGPTESPGRVGHLDEVLRGLRWIGSVRIIVQLITWGMTILTVRLLQPRDYGMVATSGLFAMVAEMLMDGGLAEILVSRRELPARTQGAAMTLILLGSLLFAGTISAIAPLGEEFFKTSGLASVIRVSSLSLPLSALCVVPTALLQRELKFRELALSRGVPYLPQGLLILGMAWFGAGYWSLIFGTLFGLAVRAAMLWSSLAKKPVPNFHFSSLRPLWLGGSQLLGQRMLWFLADQFDTFMLGRLRGPVVLGSYSLARQLSQKPVDQLAGIVNQVSMPAFAAKADSKDAQLNGLLLMILTVSALAFPMFWLACVLAPIALPLVFGARWAPMEFSFMAFAFVLPFRSIYVLLDSAIVGTGMVATTLANMWIWAIVMVPLIFVAAHFGANWVAVSWCVGFPFVLFAAVWRIARGFDASVWKLLSPVRAPMLSALVSAVVVQLVLVNLHLPAVVKLAIGALLGSACYLLLMRQHARPHFDTVSHLARRVVRF